MFWVFFFFFFFFEFRPESAILAVSADTGRFRPILADTGRFRPILADIGRYRPIQARVGPNRLASVKTTWDPRGPTWLDTAGRAGSDVPCASPRPAASDAGAAPPVPRPCFPGFSHFMPSHPMGFSCIFC